MTRLKKSTTTTSTKGKPASRRAAPAPYTRGNQNQALYDSATESDQPLAGTHNAGRKISPEPKIRALIAELVRRVERLERLLGSLVVTAAGVEVRNPCGYCGSLNGEAGGWCCLQREVRS